MTDEHRPGFPLDRRRFLETAGVLTAGAAALPFSACSPGDGSGPPGRTGARRPARAVLPFPLDRVRLGEGLFRRKRDRMIAYARGYGGEADPLAGPDRLLSIFRANAGLETRGAEPPGGWETATGYLRGHYAGHFMRMLAQAWAGTGDEIHRRKLDYLVEGLAECQAALAAAAARPTARVPGRRGGALRLTGSPIGHAEHVRLPDRIVDGLGDFTVATWIHPAEYDAGDLPPSNRDQGPSTLNNQAAVFDFGSPNPEYAEPALARMYLTVRVSDEHPVPRFAITTTGEGGEQRLDGAAPLPVGEWTHLAVTRAGTRGTLWVDGRAVASRNDMTLGPGDLGSTTGNWLGRRQFPQRSVSYLNATLDDFRIWDRALDGGHIRALLEPSATGPVEGEVLHYGFDEDGGPTAVDSSGNGRDGEIIAPTDGRRHPGFLSAYPETQFIRLEEFCTYGTTRGIWAPYYTLHKIMAGLIDAHEITGNARALDVLTGIGDWAWGRLEPLSGEQLRRMWDIYIAGEYGGVNESLAHLHRLTGKEEHLLAARRFDNAAVKDPVVAGVDVLDGRHANQHVPQFTGYLRIFEEGGPAEYHTAARNFWDMVVPHRVYGHGGTGVGEFFRERDVIAGSLYDDENHAETCPLYNLLRLSRSLFLHDPQPKYMDYYELGLFNQILGSRRDVDSAESPEVTYFVPVRPGSRRRYGNTGTCCGGTGLESHTKYQAAAYFRSADDGALYVNLYIASTLEWPERGFTVRQETAYPLEGRSTLRIEGSGPLEIRLRVPGWVRTGYTVSVNGEVRDLDAAPGTYVTVSREWRPGDAVEIALPLRFRTERAIDDPSVQAIYRGPTLMAVQAGPLGEDADLETGLPAFAFYRDVGLDGDLAPAMTPAGRPMHFTTNGYTLAPFHVADPPDPGGAREGGDVSGPPPGGGDGADATRPYHLYVRRHEPDVVFGGVDAGVANSTREDGITFLDVVWDQAPFAGHGELVATVERTAAEWTRAGTFTEAERSAVVDAARRAEGTMGA